MIDGVRKKSWNKGKRDDVGIFFENGGGEEGNCEIELKMKAGITASATEKLPTLIERKET